ncbi:hypothetical protein JKP88DRAFT_150974, partial [Tribonema minus]
QFGLSFTPGGLLFPYQLGICDAFMEAGFLTPEVPIAGSSAGALTTVVVGAGLDLREVLEETEALCEDCRTGGTRGRLRSVLVASLAKMLPEDVHERLNARAAPASVGYTALLPLPSGTLVSEFTSKEDVIGCLLASCHVPWWFNGSPVGRVRGQFVVDGFFGTPRGNFGAFPVPRAARTLRVSAFPSAIARIDAAHESEVIAPDLLGEGAFAADMLVMALNPGSTEQLTKLFEDGRKTGEIWLQKYGDMY